MEFKRKRIQHTNVHSFSCTRNIQNAESMILIYLCQISKILILGGEEIEVFC